MFEIGKRPFSTITNLNPRPYPNSDLLGYGGNYSANGAGYNSYHTVGHPLGLPYFRMNWTKSGTTEISRGAETSMTNVLVPGRTYTLSAWIRVNRTQSMNIVALPNRASTAGIANYIGVAVSHMPNVWYYHTVTFVAPAESVGMFARAYSTSTLGGTAWAAGDTLDYTGVMVTEGPTVPYFDGNAPQARWEGTPGNSRSVTLALDGIYPAYRLAEMGELLYATGHTAGVSTPLYNGPLPTARDMTLYAAHLAGATSARADFRQGSSSVLAVGRTTSGSAWFALGMNPSGNLVAPNVTRAASANVVSGVREKLNITTHSYAGNQMNTAGTISGWPQASTVGTFVSASDVRYAELWSAAHPADIRMAKMVHIKTLQGIGV